MAGLLGGIKLFERAVELAEQGTLKPLTRNAARMAPLSPWATRRNLAHVGYDSDTFGTRASGPVDAGELFRCAPVKKGRAILHATIASRPLRAITYDATSNSDAVLTGEQAPTWLYRTDTDFPPQQRMADMLDDHIAFEATVLAVLRGSGSELGGRGAILDAVHVPYDWWRVDDDGVLLINDQPVDPDSVLYIPGPSQGMTVEAQDEVRQWRSIARNIARRLATPLPSIILEDPENGASLDDDEIDELVAAAAEARRSEDGAVMYVGNLKATPVPLADDSALYIGARNATRLDLANHLALPAALLDGSPATASLTYSTREGGRDELADLSLDYWTTPITRALSQDNVVPRGTRVRFDFGDLFAVSNAPTGAPTQD